MANVGDYDENTETILMLSENVDVSRHRGPYGYYYQFRKYSFGGQVRSVSVSYRYLKGMDELKDKISENLQKKQERDYAISRCKHKICIRPFNQEWYVFVPFKRSDGVIEYDKSFNLHSDEFQSLKEGLPSLLQGYDEQYMRKRGKIDPKLLNLYDSKSRKYLIETGQIKSMKNDNGVTKTSTVQSVSEDEENQSGMEKEVEQNPPEMEKKEEISSKLMDPRLRLKEFVKVSKHSSNQTLLKDSSESSDTSDMQVNDLQIDLQSHNEDSSEVKHQDQVNEGDGLLSHSQKQPPIQRGKLHLIIPQNGETDVGQVNGRNG